MSDAEKLAALFDAYLQARDQTGPLFDEWLNAPAPAEAALFNQYMQYCAMSEEREKQAYLSMTWEQAQMSDERYYRGRLGTLATLTTSRASVLYKPKRPV